MAVGLWEWRGETLSGAKASSGDERWRVEKQAELGIHTLWKDSKTLAGRERGESALGLGGSRVPQTRLPSPPPRRLQRERQGCAHLTRVSSGRAKCKESGSRRGHQLQSMQDWAAGYRAAGPEGMERGLRGGLSLRGWSRA